MIELKIEEIKEFNEYVLLDEKTEEVYFLCLEFFKVKPDIGDKIIIPKILLNRFSPVYAQPYSFEEIDEKTLIEYKKFKKNELACLVKNDENIFLKRVYG